MKINGYADEDDIPGTEDWEDVTTIMSGDGYGWAELRAWWSPSARTLFWAFASGRSCESFSDGIATVADFLNGDRASLLRAVADFCDDHNINHGERHGAQQEIRSFRPTWPDPERT